MYHQHPAPSHSWRLKHYRPTVQFEMSTAAEFVLGHYKIGRSIGEGTFGKVRLGVHQPTGEKVAVKTLQKEKIVEQADIERVTREICILKVLRHPNIIQLYEIIQTKTDIHLVMEYAEGGELFDYIVKRKRLQEKEAVAFMHQIISGVQYIHKNGIVHRDLKPQNLLLDHNRNIKIVDFGLSNQYKLGEKLKTACGSPCYAAPQMIAGKRYECLAADLWSCGIILYAMLCGYLPFQDPNTAKLYKKIMAGEYETPKVLSADSKDLLKGILTTNPEARFRLQQIRDSRWFRQLPHTHRPEGIIIGKDEIEVDERVILKMQKHDAAQVRPYLTKNKHNQTTALYYLLKNKLEREPSLLLAGQEDKTKREESPLVYKPSAQKDYYLPTKARTQKDREKENRDHSKNDSMDVSNIISSLVEANKARIVHAAKVGLKDGKQPKDSQFDKVEDAKLFPHSKNSSIYEPRTARPDHEKGVEAQRCRNEKSLEPKQDLNFPQPEPSVQSARGEQVLNKKRQELADQLRQISIKIDQEINQLRTQNPSANTVAASSPAAKKRDILATSALSSRPKTHENSAVKSIHKDPLKASTHKDPFTASNQKDSFTASNQKDLLNTSRDSISLANKEKARDNKEKARERTAKHPRTHSGPFNTQCIFMENATSLLEKITAVLLKHNMRYQETEAYCISIGGGPQIAIESLQGMAGVHLVKFQNEHPFNQTIIEVLSK